jgi:hypothetical protein
MKRLLLIVPIVLITLLNACGNVPPALPDAIGTAVGETQTATVWTVTVSPTVDPSEASIIEWLNEEFSSADSLERTLDAQYQAVDIFFPTSPNGSTLLFRVDVHCECARVTPCCTPERIFVVTMWAMKKRQEKILPQMPGNLTEVRVVCFHSWNYIGVMSAWWSDAKGYMLGEISGFQLGARVFTSSVP